MVLRDLFSDESSGVMAESNMPAACAPICTDDSPPEKKTEQIMHWLSWEYESHAPAEIIYTPPKPARITTPYVQLQRIVQEAFIKALGSEHPFATEAHAKQIVDAQIAIDAQKMEPEIWRALQEDETPHKQLFTRLQLEVNKTVNREIASPSASVEEAVHISGATKQPAIYRQ